MATPVGTARPRLLEPCSMLSSKPEERSIERVATIQLRNGATQIQCLVTDISGGSVRIDAYGLEIPDSFVLLFSDAGPTQSGNYRVVSRLGREVDAKFVGTG
jgi:hypothetical protein